MRNLPVLAAQVTQSRKKRSPKKRGVQLPTEKDNSSENSEDDSPEPTMISKFIITQDFRHIGYSKLVLISWDQQHRI